MIWPRNPGVFSMTRKWLCDGNQLFSNRIYQHSTKKKETVYIFCTYTYVIKSTPDLDDMVRFLREWYHEYPFTGYARPHKQLNALLKIIEVKHENILH